MKADILCYKKESAHKSLTRFISDPETITLKHIIFLYSNNNPAKNPCYV